MTGNSRSNYLSRLILDWSVLAVAFLFTRHYIVSETGGILFSKFNMFILVTSLFIWHFVGKTYHLYDDFRSRTFAYEFVALVKTILGHSAIITFLFFFFFVDYPFPRFFTVVYTLLLFLLMPIQKFWFKQTLLRVRAKGGNEKRILIVGTGEIGINFYKSVVSNKHYGYRLVGFVGEKPEVSQHVPYLGEISELRSILHQIEVHDIIVALPNSSINQIDEVYGVAKNEAVRLRIIPDYFRFLSSKFNIGMFGEFPVITVRDEPLDEMQWKIIKRLIDVFIAFLVIVLVAIWLFPLIIIIQKLTSPGPIFFVQDRVGRMNRFFRCYKFRTMHVQSSNNRDYTPTSSTDLRVTRFGKFLRKLSLDELPQIINVLKGEMSIVGPRPHPLGFHKVYMKMEETIKVRHLVKPGITGWAQVHGYRGDVADYQLNRARTKKRIEYDIWYIENWTIWLDIQIIVQTAINIVKGDKNAN